MDRKFLRNYTDVMIYCMKHYSEQTVVLLSETMDTDEILLRIENYLKSEPSEQDLVALLNVYYEAKMKEMEKIGRLGYLNNRLLHDFCPFRMRKIYRTEKEAYYIITLRKKSDQTLLERAEQLKIILSGFVSENETIICDGRYLRIAGDGYCYTYTIEAYKKANMTVCFDSDGVHTKELYRMGIEDAVSHLRRSCHKHHMKKKRYDGSYPAWFPYTLFAEKMARVCERMYTPELIEALPDHAERFVHLIKQEARQFNE